MIISLSYLGFVGYMLNTHSLVLQSKATFLVYPFAFQLNNFLRVDWVYAVLFQLTSSLQSSLINLVIILPPETEEDVLFYLREQMFGM